MDRKDLTSSNLKFGKDVLSALDRQNFPVYDAFWYKVPEIDSWRYVIGTPVYDKKGPIESYKELLSRVSGAVGEDNPFINDVSIVSPNHSLLDSLRSKIPEDKRIVSNSWLSGATTSGNYLNDTFVYRLTNFKDSDPEGENEVSKVFKKVLREQPTKPTWLDISNED